MRPYKPAAQSGHLFGACEGDSEIIVVGRGRRSYLWVGPRINLRPSARKQVHTFSGPVGLRRLAFAILRAQRKRDE